MNACTLEARYVGTKQPVRKNILLKYIPRRKGKYEKIGRVS